MGNANVPPMTLRRGNAIDNGESAIPFEAELDQPTTEYIDRYHWGIPHLDSVSWCYYLPALLDHAVRNIANGKSTGVGTFLFSLRPPDRDPPRLGSLSKEQEAAIVSLLDKLAFDKGSAWKDEARQALEEYWAPGAIYRETRADSFSRK